MALVAIAADKGAPGVTTASLALATVWPRPVLLAECDAAGGDLFYRLPAADGGRLDPQRGLLSLAVAARRGRGAHRARHAGRRGPAARPGGGGRHRPGQPRAIRRVLGCRGCRRPQALQAQHRRSWPGAGPERRAGPDPRRPRGRAEERRDAPRPVGHEARPVAAHPDSTRTRGEPGQRFGRHAEAGARTRDTARVAAGRAVRAARRRRRVLAVRPGCGALAVGAGPGVLAAR